MSQKESDRQKQKISYWKYLKPAPTKRYPQGYSEKRAIYLCMLCNREFNRSCKSERSLHSTSCLSCSRRRGRRKKWELQNLDTKKRIFVVDLKTWCHHHGVCVTTLYRTKATTPVSSRRKVAFDNQGQRWKVVQKID